MFVGLDPDFGVLGGIGDSKICEGLAVDGDREVEEFF